nr:NTP transferase domain-containing protein [Streptomyces sp. HPF1205]
MTRYDAVVLAGGAAGRLGGADKPGLPMGGLMLLDRVLAACAGADRTVVVGPRRPTSRPVRWTREEPPGGGPLPALAAGLAALDDAHRSGADAVEGRLSEVVLVFAADLPFLTAATVDALAAALAARLSGAASGAEDGGGPAARPAAGTEARAAAERTGGSVDSGVSDWDGVMLTDPGGRDQPLAAAYRTEALRRELALIGTEHGRLTGLPLRLLTGELRLLRMADPTGESTFDCDTWEDVAVARARLDDRSEG